MAWIESNQTLLHHPKTSRMARLLGIQRVHAVGHLHALWYFGLDHAQEGDLSRYDAFDLAIAAEWDGDPQLFTDSIVSAGFIDRSEDGSLCLHDWGGTCGKFFRHPDHPTRVAWNAMRAKVAGIVLSRDGHHCRHCGSPERLEIDHIVPIARGGSNHLENLQVLCRPCNARKGVRL